MKNVYFLFAFVLLAISASSQNYIDLAKLDFATSSPNTFDTGTVTTSLQEINGDITLPIVINNNFTFLTGATYESTTASFNPTRAEETLTGITLKLGANIKHSEKLSGTYMLLPKISSDLKETNAEDFQVGAVVLMKYAKNDHFNYKFGLYANNELFSPFVVPIFGFYYLNPTEKFEAKVLLPLAVDLNYTIAKGTRVGLNFKGQIRTYNLNTPIGTETNRYVARSTNDVYSYLQYELASGINFQIGIGRSVGRSYRIYDEKVSLAMPLVYFGDNRTQLNTDFSDGWIYKISAFYRLKI
jgi:hypothetical protein